MADALTLTSPPARRRGRPPGSGNKRSLDLARYLEATYGGQTPGQQSAAVSMVSPADLKKARALAKELGIVDVGLSPVVLAMVVKAGQLGRALGCSRAEAWVLMAKERMDLMAYIHQKLPPKAEGKAAELPQVFLIPGAAPPIGALPQDPDQAQAAIEFLEEIGPAAPKSHG